MALIPLNNFTIAVLNLRQEISPGQISVGTGTFIVHKNIPYILTAAHVAQIMKSDCQFIVKGENDTPISLSLEDLMQGTTLPWKVHAEADMAILKLNPKADIAEKILSKRFIASEILSNERKVVDRDTLLRVIGFPLGLGAVGHFSPLTFRTHASSGFITLNRFDTKKPCTFFILENPGVGGYSGGRGTGRTMTGKSEEVSQGAPKRGTGRTMTGKSEEVSQGAPNQGTGRTMTCKGENLSPPLTLSDNDAPVPARKQLNKKQLKQFLELLIEKFKKNEDAFPKLPDVEFQDDS